MLMPERSTAWRETPAGDPRGYIQPAALRELWFHTGTNCNLRCPFCLEGSMPGNNRIEMITLRVPWAESRSNPLWTLPVPTSRFFEPFIPVDANGAEMVRKMTVVEFSFSQIVRSIQLK